VLPRPHKSAARQTIIAHDGLAGGVLAKVENLRGQGYCVAFMNTDPPTTPSAGVKPVITAFEFNWRPGWEISPASYQRQWMDESPGRGAYRCLPLSMANQAGWFIHSPNSFTAVWSGGVDPSDVALQFDADTVDAAKSVLSHFGNGIVTFQMPFLFRTPPGIGLLARGAPNWPVINFAALEGLVETDWNPASFTMNWKIMEANKPVRFEKEWPVCFVQPFDLNLPEELAAERKPLRAHQETEENYVAWRRSRAAFMNSPEKDRGGWQKDYFQGLDAAGCKVKSHRTQYQLSEFRPPASP
jgi:hypothetical protein